MPDTMLNAGYTRGGEKNSYRTYPYGVGQWLSLWNQSARSHILAFLLPSHVILGHLLNHFVPYLPKRCWEN